MSTIIFLLVMVGLLGASLLVSGLYLIFKQKSIAAGIIVAVIGLVLVVLIFGFVQNVLPNF